MDKGTLKAIVMALMSPMAIGGTLNDTSFKNLDTNAQRIIDHCTTKLKGGDTEAVKKKMRGLL